MNTLFLGLDSERKEKGIADIKKKCIPQSSAQKFDFETLHAHKLNADELKKALIALPAVSSKRLVLLREVHNLSPQNKKIIVNFLKLQQKHIVLLFESTELSPKDSFVSKIRSYVKVVELGKKRLLNVFNMTRAMENGKPPEALKILTDLLDQGDHPLQVMGGLVWFWGKCRQKLKPELFQKGLIELQEADLNIKRSRLKPSQALEVLVVKLATLLG